MLSFTALTLLGLSTATPPARTYCNARFGYCLTVPGALAAQGESDNGDGQVFLDARREVKLTVWGSVNADGNTLRERYRDATLTSPTRKVTYRVLRATWFVVSGTERGRIFYQRTTLDATRRVHASFLLEYPSGDRTAHAMITPLVKSFKFN